MNLATTAARQLTGRPFVREVRKWGAQLLGPCRVITTLRVREVGMEGRPNRRGYVVVCRDMLDASPSSLLHPGPRHVRGCRYAHPSSVVVRILLVNLTHGSAWSWDCSDTMGSVGQ
jgi:hypothetical protein